MSIVSSEPKINGIEILEGSGVPSTPTNPPPVPTNPPPGPPAGGGVDVDIYINTGSSSSVTDFDGNVWIADNYFSANSKTFSTTTSIPAVLGQGPLYQSERYESKDPQNILAYSIPVPRAGTYTATLHWAEIYFENAGSRQFTVEIQGTPMFTPSLIDIFQQAQGSNKVLKKTSPEFTVAAGENVQIKLTSVANNAKISAIEIHSTDGGGPQPTPPAPSPPTPPTGTFTPIRINAGGGQVVTTGNVVWEADRGFNSGTRTYPDGTNIDSATLIDASYEPLYQTERYDLSGGTNMMYSFQVPSGPYFVTLHLCEIYFGSAGSRAFTVKIQGNMVLENYDIVQKAGGSYKAKRETFEVFVDPGEDLEIEFISVKNNAKISAIEIEANAIGTPPAPTPPAPTPPAPTPPTNPPPPTPPGTFAGIRINVGSSSSVIDSDGNEWIPDTFFQGGKATKVTRNIANVGDELLQPVYRSERYADDKAGEGTVKYEIPGKSTASASSILDISSSNRSILTAIVC